MSVCAQNYLKLSFICGHTKYITHCDICNKKNLLLIIINISFTACIRVILTTEALKYLNTISTYIIRVHC